MQEHPDETHRSQLQGEPEPMVITSAMPDQRLVGIVQKEPPVQFRRRGRLRVTTISPPPRGRTGTRQARRNGRPPYQAAAPRTAGTRPPHSPPDIRLLPDAGSVVPPGPTPSRSTVRVWAMPSRRLVAALGWVRSRLTASARCYGVKLSWGWCWCGGLWVVWRPVSRVSRPYSNCPCWCTPLRWGVMVVMEGICSGGSAE